jgi:2-methylcitrate synthase
VSKKSVALSGVAAGNTAICTVGHTGNDLHYRGYDIAELAERGTYEEIAHLLIHGELPTQAELDDYRRRLAEYRRLPAAVCDALELIPAAAHPMDVLRTGCSVAGAVAPEGPSHGGDEARALGDRLLVSFSSMLLYWHHFSREGRRIETLTDEPSLAGHFLRLLHGRALGRAHPRPRPRAYPLRGA